MLRINDGECHSDFQVGRERYHAKKNKYGNSPIWGTTFFGNKLTSLANIKKLHTIFERKNTASKMNA